MAFLNTAVARNASHSALHLDPHGAFLPYENFPRPSPSPIQAALRFLGNLDDDEASRWSSFIGIVVAIAGNILISLALNVQKYAHIRLDREDKRLQLRLRRRRRLDTLSRRNSGSASDSTDDGTPTRERGSSVTPHVDQKYLKSKVWWSGLTLMILGEGGNFLAYGFASASIVSTLGVVALISNIIFAPLLLKEPFRKRDYLGVLVSVAGAVVVVSSSAPEEIKLGPEELLEAMSRLAFEVYFGVVCGMMVILMYLSRRWGPKIIFIDLGLVGLFGGFTVLSTKAISSLLSSSLYHIFTMPIAYPFLFTLVSTAILQIKYLNRALQHFDSTQVIPTQFVLFTLSVIIGSAILYRDFEKIDNQRLFRFVVGCALTFAGVYVLSAGRQKNDSPLAEDENESSTVDDNVDQRNGEAHPSANGYPPFLDDELDEMNPLLQGGERDVQRAIQAVVAPLVTSSRQRGRSHSIQRSADTSLASSLQRNSLTLIPPIVAGVQLHAVAGDVVTREGSRRPSLRRQHSGGGLASAAEPSAASEGQERNHDDGESDSKWEDRVMRLFGKKDRS